MTDHQPTIDVDGVIGFIKELIPDATAIVAADTNGAPEIAWGDVFFYAGEIGDEPIPRRQPFATIVTKDYPGFDEASELDRPDVFRLNVQLDRRAFDRVLADIDVDLVDHTAIDVVIPHPAYAAHHWISVVCPSEQRLAELAPWLEQAHERAERRAE